MGKQPNALVCHSEVASALAWAKARGARGLTCDSRCVQPGDVFIAWPGYGSDGRQFVQQALNAGAVACLVEADGVEAFELDVERVSAFRGLKASTGELASRFFAVPTQKLKVVAATGTNGKTSTTWWVAQALSMLGKRCGVVGTLGIGEPPSVLAPLGSVKPTGLTTPDPVTLQGAFRRFVNDGFTACAIEASSIGLVEQRLAGTQISVAIFTNFTRDHLDFHGTMQAYWATKAELFTWPGLRAAVINRDDERGAATAEILAGTSLDLWTYSTKSGKSPARLQARDVGYAESGLAFTVAEGPLMVDVRSQLIGEYNVSNLLAVMGALRALGVPLNDAAAVCSHLTAVPGRMQRADSGEGVSAVVDYAHTPDALEKALQALRPFAHERGGRLWVVFGCGGNRDATKRPLMGAIAERLADRVVVTSDNPRHEVPSAILGQIVGGMSRPALSVVLEDRRAAIFHAVRHAASEDVILVAGKGHEPEQEIAGVKHAFADMHEVQAALAQREVALQLCKEGADLVGGGYPLVPMMTLAEAHALLPGSTLIGDGSLALWRVHSDTRSLQPGDLFVALRGENFDGHDFLANAMASGAVAALAEGGHVAAKLPGLQVAHTKRTLGELAAAWRARCYLPLIAVTGSNGKTTVTQMLASVLQAWVGVAAFSTLGNFNNDIGVPLTLLRLRQDAGTWHRAGVVELGMNHVGEIAVLAAMCAPTVALVNNAQREHQEFMVSVEAVARENGAVIEALGPSGIAVFPADDPFAPMWRSMAGSRRTIEFALTGAADVTARARWASDHWAMMLHTPAGESSVKLRVAGMHNVKNALATAACALAVGCPLEAIVRGLEAFAPIKGRSQIRSALLHGASVTLIDDTYNANPDSVRAAIDLLLQLPAPRWLVLGDMGEVGDQGLAFHQEVGAYAKAGGINALWTAGASSAHAAAEFPDARHFDTVEGLLAALADAPRCASVLVKGSRFMKMEQVVCALQVTDTNAHRGAQGSQHAA